MRFKPKLLHGYRTSGVCVTSSWISRRTRQYSGYLRGGLGALAIAICALFNQAAAYNTTQFADGVYLVELNNSFKAHEWILHKALEYLQDHGSKSRQYSIDRYLNWLHYGIRYADHHNPICEWKIPAPLTGVLTAQVTPVLIGLPVPIPVKLQKDFGCDAIHHYGQIKSIEFTAFNAAHPGGFAAPEYSQTLYDQAVKFWPGGLRPSLGELPYKDAGHITVSWFGEKTDLMNTYLGGLPFCEAYVSDAANSPEFFVPGDCPKWPAWAAVDEAWSEADEGVEAALKYLGWVIHLVEDLTVPNHALNDASPEHQNYENAVDAWIKQGEFDHLPVPANGAFLNSLPFGSNPMPVPDLPDRLEIGWSIEDFAHEAARISKRVYREAETVSRGTGFPIDKKYIAERGLDAAIKLVGGILEKYFTEVSLTPDSFEENDYYTQATPLDSGRYYGLTLDSARDEDWYTIIVEEDHSNLVIDAYSDGRWGPLSYELLSMGNGFTPRFPVDTETGSRISVTGIKAGAYLLHVYRSADSAIPYDLGIALENAALPADSFEPNDHLQQAKAFHTGCRFDLNIDRAGDDDYYALAVGRYDRLDVEVTHDPAEGNLDLSINGVPALVDDGASPGSRRLVISKNGSGASEVVRVSGSQTVYSMCMDVDTCVVERTRDCLGACVETATVAAWTGDGICDNGVFGMNLMCPTFNYDGGDCDPGKSCWGGSDKVIDCRSNCVDRATALAWVGDGYCDDGTAGMDLRCTAFGHDGGDCTAAVRGDDSNSCAGATLITGGSVEAAIEAPGDVDWFEIAGSGSFAYLTIESSGPARVEGAFYSACGQPPFHEAGYSEEGNNFAAGLQVSGEYSYFIRVKNTHPEGNGNYKLTVTRTPGL